jgi:Domain of unknown function (DUF4296)
MKLKNRTKIIFVFCFPLFFACNQKHEEPEIPESILSKEQMAHLLVDIHIYESSVNMNVLNNINQSGFSKLQNWDFLSKNGINSQQYKQSFGFYSAHPNLLNQVYQLALEELSKKQVQINTQP